MTRDQEDLNSNVITFCELCITKMIVLLFHWASNLQILQITVFSFHPRTPLIRLSKLSEKTGENFCHHALPSHLELRSTLPWDTSRIPVHHPTRDYRTSCLGSRLDQDGIIHNPRWDGKTGSQVGLWVGSWEPLSWPNISQYAVPSGLSVAI